MEFHPSFSIQNSPCRSLFLTNLTYEKYGIPICSCIEQSNSLQSFQQSPTADVLSFGPPNPLIAGILHCLNSPFWGILRVSPWRHGHGHFTEDGSAHTLVSWNRSRCSSIAPCVATSPTAAPPTRSCRRCNRRRGGPMRMASLRNCRKVRKPWGGAEEKHGKSMGKAWENHGKP